MDQTNRYTAKVLTPENMRYVANQVSKIIERKLLHNEAVDLLNFAKANATAPWGNMSIDEIDLVLIKNFINSRFTAEGRDTIDLPIVDIKEILKTHIGTQSQDVNYEHVTNVDEDGIPVDLQEQALKNLGLTPIRDPDMAAQTSVLKNLDSVTSIDNIAGFLGVKDIPTLQMLINPSSSLKKNYIVLDTRHRDISSDTGSTISSFTWNFLNNSAINTEGAVNSLGNVQNVVKVQTGDIRIPYQDQMFLNHLRRISLFIQEFSSQSYIAQEGWRYHFMFSSQVESNMVNCATLNKADATFEFAKPITQLNSITISFGCPFEKIQFDVDRMLMNFAYTNPATLTSLTPHNLQTGDQIYITTFTTNDTNTDSAIIAAVNSPNGYNVNVVNSTTIKLVGLDLTTVTAPIIPYNITVYFGSKRIIIPLEITYMA